MTRRAISLRTAILTVLANLPSGYLLPDDLLRTDASRLVAPRPTTAELDQQIREADISRQITGVPSDEGTKWGLSDVGRAWLAEHP